MVEFNGIHLKMLKYHFWTRHIQWCLVRFGNVSYRLVNGCMDMFNPVLSKSIFFESIAFGCLPHKVASLWREEEELRNMIGQQLLLAADDGRLETILTDNMKVSGDGSKAWDRN